MEVVIGGVVGALVGLAGTVYVAHRQRSGGVHTSEAGELWQASTEFRSVLMERLDRMEKAEELCQANLAKANARITELERRVRQVENGEGR